MLNKIVVAGRLTKDPEVRYSQTAKPVTTMTIACDRDFKTKEGEKETDFINIVVWGALAEFVERCTGKGLMIVAEGRLQMRKWEDKDGNKRTSAEVVASNIYPMEWRKGDAFENVVTQEAPAFEDSDLPF